MVAGNLEGSSAMEQQAMNDLKGLTVAILADNGFEQVELLEPRRALEEAGAETLVVSPQRERVRGWDFTEWGQDVPVDVALDRAKAGEFDALLLPGGVMNPDRLRMQPAAMAFVRHFVETGKPVAVICHGPWTLIEAGVASGRRITSWPSLKTDLRNAGANWVDQEVVVDGNLVSSRKPDDIPAFNRAMIELFSRAPRREAALRGGH
jgi:protease I